MLTLTSEAIQGLRNLTQPEALEALTRLTEDDVIAFHTAADAWVHHLDGHEDGVELLYVAARARLADINDFYRKGRI